MAVAFKVGERVRFLHENQEGVVQEVLGSNSLLVLIDDFLELEVSPSELVKIHAAEAVLLDQMEEEEEQPQAVPLRPLHAPPSLVVLKNPFKEYEFWMTNESTDEVVFTAYLRVKDKFQGINAGSVPPREKLYLGKFTAEDFHRANLIQVQLLKFPRAGKVRPQPPFSMEIGIKKRIFQQQATAVPAVGGQGWEFVLEEEKASKKQLSSDFARITEQKPASRNSRPPQVYDLHIEKLVDNPTRVDSRTMLLIQMEHFDQKLSEARLAGEEKVIFIHGVGVGALKKQIRNALKGYDFVSRFGNADPLEYGNGATWVELM